MLSTFQLRIRTRLTTHSLKPPTGSQHHPPTIKSSRTTLLDLATLIPVESLTRLKYALTQIHNRRHHAENSPITTTATGTMDGSNEDINTRR